MGNNNSTTGKRSKGVGQAAKRRLYVHLALLVLVFGAMAVGVFLFLNGRQTAELPPDPPMGQESVNAPGAQPGFDRLKGRWQRPDGGYIIDIKEVDVNGKMSAAYFNPRPIHVSRVEAALDGATSKVFIELRDANYPGATYHLTHDPGSDQPRGRYFQPKLQQTFDVFFVRMK